MHRAPALFAALCMTACAASSADTPPAAEPPATAAPQQEAPPAAPAAAPAPAASTLGFSEAQAGRGRDAFRASCTECHYSSEFRDSQFKFKWRRRTAGDLFELISTSMPESAPGSLAPQSYADLVAYILQMNGFEPGSGELPPDPERLDGLSLSPLGN